MHLAPRLRKKPDRKSALPFRDTPSAAVNHARLGAAAAKLIQEKKYGYMVAVKNNEITEVPLEEVAGKLKTVDPNCSMIQEAKMIGISFGDE